MFSTGFRFVFAGMFVFQRLKRDIDRNRVPAHEIGDFFKGGSIISLEEAYPKESPRNRKIF